MNMLEKCFLTSTHATTNFSRRKHFVHYNICEQYLIELRPEIMLKLLPKVSF